MASFSEVTAYVRREGYKNAYLNRHGIPTQHYENLQEADASRLTRNNPHYSFIPSYMGQFVAVKNDVLSQVDTQQGAGGGGNAYSSAGGSNAASGGAAPSTALAATQAGQPAYTGGGQGFKIGAVDNRLVLSERADEFEGVDAYTPPHKLPLSKSPNATNWNALEVVGSRCVRRGTAKMLENRDTLTDQH